MNPIRVSAVSYLNTFPFVYGLKESGMLEGLSLELDVPSICAQKLKAGEVDVALIPVGALPDLKEYRIITDYCIGAVSEVKTVLLLSQVPINQITRIFLDFDSRTSVELVKVLSKEYWHISPAWSNMNQNEAGNYENYESIVAIGDKTFNLRTKFSYCYDLAGEWIGFTGLPFVFAVWATCTNLEEKVVKEFNQAFEFGIRRKVESLNYFREKLPNCDDCLDYLERNISYQLDGKKLEGLNLFLKFLKK